MKDLRRLGLASIAALSLMASVGVGSASATTLFTDSAKTSAYASGTSIQAELVPGTTTRFTSGGSTIATCTSSSLQMTTSSTSGAWISGFAGWWTWGGCSQTTHTVDPGGFEIHFTSGSDGSFWGFFNEVTLSIFGVSCTYGNLSSHTLGTITGGSTPVIKIAATLSKKAGGFLCPSTAGWDAEYQIWTPHALFVGN